jgi:hypothetical protein
MGPETFDFWVGEWDCASDTGPATNSLTKEYGGKVIFERFTLLEPRRWAGMSVSVYSERDGWRQTWVDEDGNYWAFVGRMVDGGPSFATEDRVDADQLYKRMVFSDIGPDSFNWRWESSPDGEDWKVNWNLVYTRRS